MTEPRPTEAIDPRVRERLLDLAEEASFYLRRHREPSVRVAAALLLVVEPERPGVGVEPTPAALRASGSMSEIGVFGRKYSVGSPLAGTSSTSSVPWATCIRLERAGVQLFDGPAAVRQPIEYTPC